jgi:hypothetical protein
MKWIEIFIKSAGAILLMAALERFLIAAGGAQYLSLPEAMLGMPLRFALLAAGALELLVSIVCLFGKQPRIRLGWLVWTVLNYIGLQICLFWMGMQAQGSILGSLGDPLELARGLPGMVTRLGTAFLVLGTLATAGWVWIFEPAFARRRAAQNRSQKVSCPSCGGHIGFTLLMPLGRGMNCPHCRKDITLIAPR